MRQIPVLAFISLIGIALFSNAALAFVPSTLFQVQVTPSVDYESKSKTFIYHYNLRNLAGSQQSIKDFAIAYGESTLNGIEDAPHWHHRENFQQHNVLKWYATDRRFYSVAPGASLGGYTVRSRSLPAITQVWLRSSYEHDFSSQEEVTETVNQGLLDFFKNSVTLDSVGPGTAPGASLDSIVSKLVDTKHLAYDRGWISKGGAVTSLDAKLDAAMNSLRRGQTEAASNQLGSFIKELDAQRGKSVNDVAYSLLYPVAQYVRVELQ